MAESIGRISFGAEQPEVPKEDSKTPENPLRGVLEAREVVENATEDKDVQEGFEAFAEKIAEEGIGNLDVASLSLSPEKQEEFRNLLKDRSEVLAGFASEDEGERAKAAEKWPSVIQSAYDLLEGVQLDEPASERRWFRFGDRRGEEPSSSPGSTRSPLEEVSSHLEGREGERKEAEAEEARKKFRALQDSFYASERILEAHGMGSAEDQEAVGEFGKRIREFFESNPNFSDLKGVSRREVSLEEARQEYLRIQREYKSEGRTSPETERRWNELMNGMVYWFRVLDADNESRFSVGAPEEEPPSFPTPEPGEIHPPEGLDGGIGDRPLESAEERRERIERESKGAMDNVRDAFRRSERARIRGGSEEERDETALKRFEVHIKKFLGTRDLDFSQMGLSLDESKKLEDICGAYRAAAEDTVRFGPREAEHATAKRAKLESIRSFIALLGEVEKREVEEGSREPIEAEVAPPPEELPVRERTEKEIPGTVEGLSELSEEELEQVTRGFFHWGRILQEKRGYVMAGILSGASRPIKSTLLGKIIKKMSEDYKHEGDKARGERFRSHKRKLSRTRDAGLLAGNVLRYGSVFANVGNFGNPMRLALWTSMFAGRMFGATKNAVLEKEDWMEQRRVGSPNAVPWSQEFKNLTPTRTVEEQVEYEDQLGLTRAMEEAYALNNAINERCEKDGMSVTEAYELEYDRQVSADVQKRFARAERDGLVGTLLEKIAHAEYQWRVTTVDRKIASIERRQKRGELSREDATKSMQYLLTKHRAFIKEVDGMVSDAGYINTSAYMAKGIEYTSKGATVALTTMMGMQLLSRLADAAEHIPTSWEGATDSGDHDVAHEFAPTEEELRASGGGMSVEDLRELRELKGDQPAALAEATEIEAGEADAELEQLRAQEQRLRLMEEHQRAVGGPPNLELRESIEDTASAIEDASARAAELHAAASHVVETGELPPDAPVSEPLVEASESIHESHVAEEGPHIEAVYKIEKGDSPIKALKELYKAHPDAFLKEFDLEKLKAGDLDRLVTRKVVAEYLFEYGLEESGHYDNDADRILNKALDGWMEKNSGVDFDPQDQKQLQELVSHISRSDFNMILEDKVPNLVYEGDIVAIDSNGNYDVTSPEEGIERTGHIGSEIEESGREVGGGEVPEAETRELKNDLIRIIPLEENEALGESRLGNPHLGEHVEVSHGLGRNPFEGLLWKLDGRGFQYSDMTVLFDDQKEDAGFTKVIGYKPAGSREVDAIFFYDGNSMNPVYEFSRERSGESFTETKSQFHQRIVRTLEQRSK